MVHSVPRGKSRDNGYLNNGSSNAGVRSTPGARVVSQRNTSVGGANSSVRGSLLNNTNNRTGSAVSRGNRTVGNNTLMPDRQCEASLRSKLRTLLNTPNITLSQLSARFNAEPALRSMFIKMLGKTVDVDGEKFLVDEKIWDIGGDDAFSFCSEQQKIDNARAVPMHRATQGNHAEYIWNALFDSNGVGDLQMKLLEGNDDANRSRLYAFRDMFKQEDFADALKQKFSYDNDKMMKLDKSITQKILTTFSTGIRSFNPFQNTGRLKSSASDKEFMNAILKDSSSINNCADMSDLLMGRFSDVKSYILKGMLEETDSPLRSHLVRIGGEEYADIFYQVADNIYDGYIHHQFRPYQAGDDRYAKFIKFPYCHPVTITEK